MFACLITIILVRIEISLHLGDGEDISSRKMETKSGSDLGSEIDDLLADSEKEDENDDNNDDKADQLDPVSSDNDFLSKPKDQEESKIQHTAEKVNF